MPDRITAPAAYTASGAAIVFGLTLSDLGVAVGIGTAVVTCVCHVLVTARNLRQRNKCNACEHKARCAP